MSDLGIKSSQELPPPHFGCPVEHFSRVVEVEIWLASYLNLVEYIQHNMYKLIKTTTETPPTQW